MRGLRVRAARAEMWDEWDRWDRWDRWDNWDKWECEPKPANAWSWVCGGDCGTGGAGESASQSQRMHGAGYVGAIVGRVRVLRRLGGLGRIFFWGLVGN